MIHGIMDSSIGLSESDAEWGKALMTFPGGEITDIGNGRLVLSRPDGRNPPEQSLEFYLILAMAEERFIMVTQLVNGQSTFIYGIHWHETPGGGEVVAIFPDLDATDAEN